LKGSGTEGRDAQPSQAAPLVEGLTPLQLVMRQHCLTLALANDLDDRERAAFADIGARMFARSLGPELAVLEAEQIARRAA
jgi:hypothetical protein